MYLHVARQLSGDLRRLRTSYMARCTRVQLYLARPQEAVWRPASPLNVVHGEMHKSAVVPARRQATDTVANGPREISEFEPSVSGNSSSGHRVGPRTEADFSAVFKLFGVRGAEKRLAQEGPESPNWLGTRCF